MRRTIVVEPAPPSRMRRLLARFARRIVPDLTPEIARETFAISDTRRIGTNVEPRRDYNPDDLVRRRGGLRIYDEMYTDEQVAACVGLQTAAILGSGWSIEAVDEHDTALADLVREDLEALPGTVEHALAEILGALKRGFSVAELEWMDREGRLALSAIRSIAPHDLDFEIDGYGIVTGIMQVGSDTFPPAKFVHFTIDAEFSNPYGHSPLRAAYTPWFAKALWRQAMNVWGEKLADAPIVGSHATNATAEKIAAAQAVLENLQARTVLMVPEDWKVSTLTDARDPKRTFLDAIDHYDRAIAKALLVPDKIGVAGGEVAGGSYSLAQTQFDAWTLWVSLRQRDLEACVQEQIIARMCTFAGVEDRRLHPKFNLKPVTADNREVAAQRWEEAVKGKVVHPTLRDENWYRGLLGAPELSEEEWQIIQDKQEEMQQQISGGGDKPDDSGDGEQTPRDGGDAQEMPGDQPDEKLAAIIRHEHGKWVLYSHEGDVLGRHDTEEKALAQEHAVNIAKARAAGHHIGMASPMPRADAIAVPSSFWRPLTNAEQRANMAQKRDAIESSTRTLATLLADGSKALVRDMKTRASAIVKGGLAPQAIRDLAGKTSTAAAVRQRIEEHLVQAYNSGLSAAKRESGLRVAVTLSPLRGSERIELSDIDLRGPRGLIGTEAQRYFRAKSFWITGLLEDEIVKRTQAVLFNALKGDKLPRTVELEVDEALAEWLPVRDAAGRLVNAPARVETIARTNIADAVNSGRFAAFSDPDVADAMTGLQYSAVMDDRTREDHAAWDGVVKPSAWWLGPPDRRPPNGFNCRCMLVPVTTVDEQDITPDDELPTVEVTDPGFK